MSVRGLSHLEPPHGTYPPNVYVPHSDRTLPDGYLNTALQVAWSASLVLHMAEQNVSRNFLRQGKIPL